jgi:dimethylargininase
MGQAGSGAPVIAFVRQVAPSLARCELTHLARAPIDVPQAQRQHAQYVAVLSALGCHIEWLAPLAEHPDGVFVEDTAVLVPEVALITRPGATSRRDEVGSVAAALARHVPVRRVTDPACLEGGDVLRIGRTLYVGASGRTNPAGVAQLAEGLRPFGYLVREVALRGCLHLKSACTFIAPDVLLANPSWIDPSAFDVGVVIAVDPHEAFAANTLTLGGLTLVSSAYPRTQRALEAAGIVTRAVEVGELHKAEAALTCMSLLLEPPAALNPP